jgi:hypothetical protein
MKISSFIMFLLFISAIFAVYGLMVHEANQQYTDTILNYVPINSANWSDGGATGVAGGGQFDFVNGINGTIGPLQNKFKTITNEDEGWFSKLTAGITAIPYAVLLVPDVLWNTMVMGTLIIGAFFGVLNIPVWFIIAASVGVLVWAIFKLLEFYQRVPL